ncbi:MAG: sugar ABC transporter permease [Lachnospiraceae bacterium]|nr:sugar ABC transporter permease [Lachnospiraceae bacterium]MDE6186469.1 sugar ABC transporter permease [Lachnospiraceae bacterium]
MEKGGAICVSNHVSQKRSRALQRREDIAGYGFMLPSLIFFVGFVLIPMVICVYLSMTDSNMHTQSGGNFVGLTNFINLAKDKVFLDALWNTFVIVFVSVPAVAAFSLWVSSAIYKLKMPVLSAFRCIFYLPVVTGSVAVTVVWKWIFDNYTGILNSILKTTGAIESNINWLGDERYALWCIILILFTTSVGQPIVLYVSALGNVDASLVEAAQVDGATDLQVFWKIKWPQIMPTTLYILVITTINSFQCFALIQLLTQGGSGTQTVMYYIYYTAFKLTEQAGHFGYANAMGVILAIFIGILSAVQMWLAKEK